MVVAARPASAGGGYEKLERIQALAEAQVESATRELPGRVEISAGPVDRHLRLPACDDARSFVPRGTRLWGRAVVGVRCSSPQAWTVMVPVSVKVFGPAVYTARPLAAGEPLTRADLQIRDVDLTQLPAGVVTDVGAAIGRVPRLALSAGLPVRAGMLKGVTIISPGHPVTLVYRDNGYVVKAEGKALNAAAAGQSVQVRTPSGRVITGVAVAPGEVEVR